MSADKNLSALHLSSERLPRFPLIYFVSDKSSATSCSAHLTVEAQEK